MLVCMCVNVVNSNHILHVNALENVKQSYEHDNTTCPTCTIGEVTPPESLLQDMRERSKEPQRPQELVTMEIYEHRADTFAALLLKGPQTCLQWRITLRFFFKASVSWTKLGQSTVPAGGPQASIGGIKLLVDRVILFGITLHLCPYLETCTIQSQGPTTAD